MAACALIDASLPAELCDTSHEIMPHLVAGVMPPTDSDCTSRSALLWCRSEVLPLLTEATNLPLTNVKDVCMVVLCLHLSEVSRLRTGGL